jgi:UDP-glucose 4-epimerase|tara:strand:- start:3447 stop:4304 length:858 start_codon:yes stop_codon:yes gene_type:complete
MKILVTGGAGFIGINLIERLAKEGHEVHSLDNYTTGNTNNHLPTIKYYKGDVSEYGSFEGFLSDDYEIIYHLAAQSRVQPSFEDPSKTFTSNVLGTKRVCEYALKIGAKVVYAGSSSKHHDPSTSPYAMYKYLGEGICKLYKQSFNLEVEICRFYNVYGPDEALDEVDGNVIGIWRSRIDRGADIEIVGDGEQRRDFTHVKDIVDGLYKVGMKNIEHHDAWELGTGINYSINELAKMFQNKFNCEISYLEDQPGNYRVTLCENEDAIDLLGWKPKDRLLYYIQSL